MTEIERQELRDLKAKVSSDLLADWSGLSARYVYALDTDTRIREYVSSVIHHPDEHNLYEILGVRHFFRLLDKWFWRPEKALHFFRFYEAVRFSGLQGRLYRRSSSEPSMAYGTRMEDGSSGRPISSSPESSPRRRP